MAVYTVSSDYDVAFGILASRIVEYLDEGIRIWKLFCCG